MVETYEQALERILTRYGIRDLTKEDRVLRAILEREARGAVEIAGLPILEPDSRGSYRCIATTREGKRCSRFLMLNFGPEDSDGYSSLNCVYHGWVGKWKEITKASLGPISS